MLVRDNRVDRRCDLLCQLLGDVHSVVHSIKKGHERRVAILLPTDLSHVGLERLDNHLACLRIGPPDAPRGELGAILGVKPVLTNEKEKYTKIMSRIIDMMGAAHTCTHTAPDTIKNVRPRTEKERVKACALES